jgi:hypothetical protein
MRNPLVCPAFRDAVERQAPHAIRAGLTFGLPWHVLEDHPATWSGSGCRWSTTFYLEFLQPGHWSTGSGRGRCRPNTVLVAAYDLRVFFGAVGNPAAEVVPSGVLE